MSDPIATYSFLPWLRQGIANQIQVGTSTQRAELSVTLELQGEGINPTPLVETITKAVQVYGPGDVVGIESRAIIKTEPRNWITNFEPNYLAYIDFYDEDFPWRYTPAAPDDGHLTPWLMLVVLEERAESQNPERTTEPGAPAAPTEAGVEFREGTNIKDKPLPYIEVPDAQNIFPSYDELWAWAHVQVNHDLHAREPSMVSTGSAMDATVLPNLQAVLSENPDLAYSRILCPRHLEPNKPYHAFLLPVFESGRLAGLGLNPQDTPEPTASAWADYSEKKEATYYPYYYRWYFRTGTVGDFEYLVRLLKPKPVDARVGRRDMNVQNPGSNIPGITHSELGSILKLGGALKVPDENLSPTELEEANRYENWATPYPRPFQEKLADFINLADDYQIKPPQEANSAFLPPPDPSQPATDLSYLDDPLITPPLYGCWHALTRRLLTDQDSNPVVPNNNWVHELNLDPRHRVTAGFGTDVVKKHQEEYMQAAWEQIGDVLEANHRIRLAQLAKEIAWIWYDRHLRPLQADSLEKALVFTAPVHRKVVSEGFTISHHISRSRVPTAAISTAMRRITRSRARLMQSLPYEGSIQPDTLLARINAGEVSAALPKRIPSGLITVDQLAEVLNSEDPLGEYQELIDAFREDNQTVESVDVLPRSPAFIITEIYKGFQPQPGTKDSPEAERFKEAIRDLNRLLEASKEASRQTPKVPLDLSNILDAIIVALNPEVTIPRRTLSTVDIPERLKENLSQDFQEVMAYPEIDIPMYKPLSEISSELFLPNINLVEQNSITVLVPNQKFIEAYMVGLNHEFARELLWREYPTDQRGSYFRQFWDVSSYFSTEALDPEELKEKLRDIPPIHSWLKSSELGAHDHRELPGSNEQEVVLVIRGELLKKYPTAVVYAHQAEWQLNPDGSINTTNGRSLLELSDAEKRNPPRGKVQTPLYQAKIEPDIYFFGFDITVQAARGSEDPNDAGWFFVIKERPGEPRFGLDVDRQGDRNTWNDLAWSDVLPNQSEPNNNTGDPHSSTTNKNYLALKPLILDELPDPGDDVDENSAEAKRYRQYLEDVDITWSANSSSAELAYILYQVPVMIAVHAVELLPPPADS